jgi:hypothetical protein
LASPPETEHPLCKLDREQLLALIASMITVPLPPGVPSPSSEPDDEGKTEEADAREVSLASLGERLEKIEDALALLVSQRTVKDWYSTSEAAQILGKAEFTVREWCRLGRIRAAKRPCGRGKAKEWAISHAELERVRNEGLLPL